MIKDKVELNLYLESDKIALGKKKKHPSLLGLSDCIWRYEISLRKHEYYSNTKPHSIMCKLWSALHSFYGLLLGLQIPCNTFGKGLRINHFGLLVVNSDARIGEWCDIHQGVNIGADFKGGVPKIGDYVWIGPGAKLYGDITIGDKTVVGANAVVNKSFGGGVTIAGSPAKVVSEKANPYFH